MFVYEKPVLRSVLAAATFTTVRVCELERPQEKTAVWGRAGRGRGGGGRAVAQGER